LTAGSAGAIALIATKPIPKTRQFPQPAPNVEIQAIAPVVCDVPVVGYGTVRPKRQVKIIPEVSGGLTFVHKNLAVGNLITKGDLLFEIDARPYTSKVQQVKAEVERLEAQLKRHEHERISLTAKLDIAAKQLKLAQQSIAREMQLLSQNSGTAPELEAAEERGLRYEEAVQEHQSLLAMIPIQIEETDAMLRIKRAELDQAVLNVEKTKIHCPFDARVDAVTAQKAQAVIANFQIAIMTDMEALEISVIIDPRELRWADQDSFADAADRSADAGPDAKITWTLLGREYAWDGKVVRLERLDELTRTAHVIVELRDILQHLKADRFGDTPPVSVGMFCRAELPTVPLQDALIVPRHAVHDDQSVYVFEPDADNQNQGRLAIKRVPILRSLGDDVLVAYKDKRDKVARDTSPESTPCELEPGDRVVVSPLPKAVEGMTLTLRTETRTLAAGPEPALDFPINAARVLGSVTGAR
jgi:multidrug efflux pump subunit AcrA (membrane-fusion protein)